MAEEITNFKKIFVKHGIEEEPVIVIQRFLNLFKQLHIFDEPQKNRFNTMILDFPAELRGTFKILPGGALLQDYVDDLEVATGNIRDKSVNISGSLTQDESSQNGAATAPMAGNMALGGKIVADESFAKELAKAFSGTNAAGPIGGKVIADESFAKEITGAINQVIKHNAENKKENERFFFEESIKTQSELFSQMAKTQSKELTNAMVVALREAQELSIKSFIEAIKTIHIQPYAASNNNPIPQTSLNVVNGEEIVNEDDEWDYVEVDANEAKSSDSNSNPAPQISLNVVNGVDEVVSDDDEWDYVEVDANETETSDNSLQNYEEKQPVNQITVDESLIEKTPVMVAVPAVAFPEIEVKTSEALETSDDFDFEFLEKTEDSQKTPDFQQIQPTPAEIVAETTSEMPKVSQTSPILSPVPPVSTEGEEEWEWQETSDATADSGNTLDETIEQDEGEESSGDEDDWEWEYEEVENNTPSPPIETVSTLLETPDEEEWEWEYEEIPAEGKDEEGEVMEEERFIPSQPSNIPSKSSN